MPFTLPPLPYASDALEPHIDKMTMEIHHGKHHGAYVTNVNKALEAAPDLANKTIEQLLANNCAIVPENIRTAVRNNGGGHINHSMFWRIMKPGGGGPPIGNLAQAIHGTGIHVGEQPLLTVARFEVVFAVRLATGNVV